MVTDIVTAGVHNSVSAHAPDARAPHFRARADAEPTAGLNCEPDARVARAWEAAASVCDPEIPVLTIADLGVLREVAVDGDRVTVTITPTYSGCPAMDAIRDDILLALAAAGFGQVDVRLTLERKLAAYGIAPPTGRAAAGPVKLALAVKCPRCGSLQTREVTRFGSTSCKALYECGACLEPFDHFKVH